MKQGARINYSEVQKSIALGDWLLFTSRIRETSSMNLYASTFSEEDHQSIRRFATLSITRHPSSNVSPLQHPSIRSRYEIM